jgi:hypothetical protein
VIREDFDHREAARTGTPSAEPGAPTYPEQERVLTDREVPLERSRMPDVIQRWLDGEDVSEGELRASGHYDLWRKVEEETSRRRRLRTPAPLPDQIMRAIKKE